MAADGPTAECLEGEELKVARWRTEKFEGLGFNGIEAEVLAMGDADWHDVETLVENGCPLPLAFALST